MPSTFPGGEKNLLEITTPTRRRGLGSAARRLREGGDDFAMPSSKFPGVGRESGLSLQPQMLRLRALPEVQAGLSPGDFDDQLAKMRLLGHMRKRLRSLVECKFAIHHRGDTVLLDETIHAFEIFA